MSETIIEIDEHGKVHGPRECPECGGPVVLTLNPPKVRAAKDQVIRDAVAALSDEDLSQLWHDAAHEEVGDLSGKFVYDNEESPVRLREALEKVLLKGQEGV